MNTLDTLILASKKFHTFKFIRWISYFILATLASYHYMKLASLKLATSTSENGKN